MLIETLGKIVHTQMTKYCFNGNVVQELQSLYMPESVDAWLNIRDKKNHLLGFEDCLFDFNTSPPRFRKGNAEDMVTIRVKYTE